MSQDLIPVSLTPAEYRLLMGLRDVPESSLKTRVKALIEALVPDGPRAALSRAPVGRRAVRRASTRTATSASR